MQTDAKRFVGHQKLKTIGAQVSTKEPIMGRQFPMGQSNIRIWDLGPMTIRLMHGVTRFRGMKDMNLIRVRGIKYRV